MLAKGNGFLRGPKTAVFPVFHFQENQVGPVFQDQINLSASVPVVLIQNSDIVVLEKGKSPFFTIGANGTFV